MKNKWLGKKSITGAFLIAMFLALGIACSRRDIDPWIDEGYGKPEGIEDFMEITWLLGGYSEEEEEAVTQQKSWFREIVEDYFNVAIVPAELETSGSQSLGIQPFLASDQFPDCALLDLDPYILLGDGLIRTIPEPMIRSNMPNYSRFLDEEFLPGWGALGENRAASREYEREYLTLTFPSAVDMIPQEGLATRIDWAKSVGVEFPNYQEKKIPLNQKENVFWLNEDISVEWWEKLLLAYRDGDPDGNGRIDTIPWPSERWGAVVSGSWMWGGVRGCFGPVNGPVIENGELTMAVISDGYKQWCKMVQRWIFEGLVDRENFDRNTYFACKKITQGQIGAAPVYLWYIDQDPDSIMPPATMGGEDNAEVVVIPPLVGPDGKRGPYATPYWDTKYFFGYEVDDAKLERILKIIEFLYCSGEENYVYAHFGNPGIHFHWEGEAWNSRPILKDMEDIPRGYPRIGGFGEARVGVNVTISSSRQPSWNLEVGIPHVNAYTLDLLKFEVSQRVYSLYNSFLSGSLPGNQVKWTERHDFYYNPDYRKTLDEYSYELGRRQFQFLRNIVRGFTDVDSEWDDYVDGWRSHGGEELLKAIEGLPSVKGILCDG